MGRDQDSEAKKQWPSAITMTSFSQQKARNFIIIIRIRPGKMERQKLGMTTVTSGMQGWDKIFSAVPIWTGWRGDKAHGQGHQADSDQAVGPETRQKPESL